MYASAHTITSEPIDNDASCPPRLDSYSILLLYLLLPLAIYSHKESESFASCSIFLPSLSPLALKLFILPPFSLSNHRFLVVLIFKVIGQENYATKVEDSKKEGTKKKTQ